MGALLGGGVATSMAQTEPACEPGADARSALAFGASGYGARGYGGVA